ncbi:MAG: MFS transporter [Verrucomicrobiaceae bacterium]|nr:MFS transporter [Verrucomicrobiaceae bacterium]
MSESPISPETIPPEDGPRSWRSLVSVLVVQAHNAFNDNFVKLALITLTVTVAAGTTMARYVENILAAMVPLPFILFAPLAGWLSDRFAKSRVIQISLLAKLLIFGLFLFALSIRSLPLALFADFLFLVQSTLFSPAKFGILKEIIGSKRLGAANGVMQMLTMAGILAGMAIAGWWFDAELAQRNEAHGVSPENAWGAATHLFVWAAAAAAIPVLLGLLIRRTPEHPDTPFRIAILGSHFADLKYMLCEPVLRRTGLLIATYWFVANFLGLAFFGFAKELYPDAAEGGVGESSARMLTIIAGGLILGSLLVSFLSRKGNRLPLTLFGGLAMAIGLLAIGTLRPESLPWYSAIGGIGFASGFFLVPLSAHLQDRIDSGHRGRVLAAQNLIISFSGIVAILANAGMKLVGMGMAAQTLVLVPGMLAVTLILARLLKTSALFPPDRTA